MVELKGKKKPFLVYGVFSFISLVLLPALHYEDIMYLYTWEHFQKPGFHNFIAIHSLESISLFPKVHREGIDERAVQRAIKSIRASCSLYHADTFLPSQSCKNVLQTNPQLEHVLFVIQARTFKNGIFEDFNYRISMDRKNGVVVENL